MSDQEITLREMTDQLTEIQDQLEENGGELTPEMEAIYDKLQIDRKEKFQRTIQYIRRLKMQAEGLKGEAGKLTEMAKKKLGAVDYSERRLLAEMQVAGDKQIITDLYTIKRAKIGRPRIELRKGRMIEGLAPHLIRVIPEKWEVDLNAVWKHLKDTEIMPKEPGQFEIEDFDITVRERISIS